MEAQIVNTDGSILDPDADVGPVDLWMHSLFSDVRVSLSEQLVGHRPACIPTGRTYKLFSATDQRLSNLS